MPDFCDGVPIKANGVGAGRDFIADVIEHLCRCLGANIQYRPADHPRVQGSAERLGGWKQDILTELSAAWSKRWDEHVAPVCWIKRTSTLTSSTGYMLPLELRFGRKSQGTILDTLVPHMNDTKLSGVFIDASIEQRQQTS